MFWASTHGQCRSSSLSLFAMRWVLIPLTADVTTLMKVVERLRTRFGIERACVVADRGMISAATMAALEARGIDYILGVRERSTSEVRNTVIEDDGIAVPLLIPRQTYEKPAAGRNSRRAICIIVRSA